MVIRLSLSLPDENFVSGRADRTKPRWIIKGTAELPEEIASALISSNLITRDEWTIRTCRMMRLGVAVEIGTWDKSTEHQLDQDFNGFAFTNYLKARYELGHGCNHSNRVRNNLIRSGWKEMDIDV